MHKTIIKPLYNCLIGFAILLTTATSQTTLPNFFGDSMVLQQQMEVPIWGSDKANQKITIQASWGKQATTTSNANGQWKLKLATPTAGGPFKVTIRGTSTIEYKNVLVGEVWFCSGQSNMEMPVKGYNNQPVLGSNDAILHSTNNNIRCFNAPRNVTVNNATNANAKWLAATPANTGNFSAVAYFFAKKMYSILNVPIGIIHTSWGGSIIESWMDSTTLSSVIKVTTPDSVTLKNANSVHTALYKSMLHPFMGYGIKGFLWYQGESNRTRPQEYQKLFPLFINTCRNQWQQGNFPFYFVQVAPHSGLPNNNINGGYIREAQLKTMLAVENTGMAVTLDIGEQFLIHPAQKELVGNRLAYWALAKTYNIQGIAYSGPIVDKIESNKNDTITLSFKHAEMGLNSFGKPLSDFEIAGEDKKFYPANAFFTKGKLQWVSVTSDSVKNPVHVRYGFKNWLQGSLFNTAGLPAPSFRTDNW